MPFPKEHAAKGGGKGAGEEPDACGLCAVTVNKEEPWIEGICSSCGPRRPFHFDCVADFMEKVYARAYPQNIFARNTHIMSRKPICPGKLGAKDCPGLMDQAELHRPHKAAAAAAEAGEGSMPAPAPIPHKKQHKQQPAAAPPAPKQPKQPKPAPATPAAAPSRSSSGTSMVSNVSGKLGPPLSRPGGGPAAAFGPSKLDSGRGTPTFAQLQLAEQKAREREQREQRAAAAARAKAAASGAAPSTEALQQHSAGAGMSAADWGGHGHSEMTWDQLVQQHYSSSSFEELSAYSQPASDAAAGSQFHLVDWPAQQQINSAHQESWAGAGEPAGTSTPTLLYESIGAAGNSARGVEAYLEDEDDQGSACSVFDLAAALRRQQQEMQRQWQQQAAAGQQAALWQQQAPASAQTIVASSTPDPVPAMAAETPVPYWEALPASKAVPAQHAELDNDAEVDELLALMGIS